MPQPNEGLRSALTHENLIHARKHGGTSIRTTCDLITIWPALCLALALMLCMPQLLRGQEETGSTATSPATRAGLIQAQRLDKAAALAPEELTPAENNLTTVKHTAQRLLQEGNVHLRLGGLPSGAGFGVGPVIEVSNSTDSVRAELSAVG